MTTPPLDDASIERAVVVAVAARLGVSGDRLTPSGVLAPWARQRMKELALRSVDDLTARLVGDPGEWNALLNVVLNGQTYFFRDAEQIDALVSAALDDPGPAPVRVWSAGCSTGEEVYTLAIETMRRRAAARVVGTDVNPAALHVARDALYFAWKLRHAPADVAATYFREEATPEGAQHRVRDDVRAAVSFAEHNLARDPAPVLDGRRDYDVVVCRNVLIYYDARDREVILRRLADAVRPGGLLILGASDDAAAAPAGTIAVVRHGRLVLQRTARGATSAPTPLRAAPIAPPTTPAAPRTYSAVADRVTQLIEKSDLAGATRLVEDVVAATPQDVAALHALGQLHLLAHAFAEAERALRAACELDPLLPDTHVLLGLLHRKRGAWDEACLSFQRALFLDPRSWIAAYFAWGSLLRVGRVDDAELEARRALRLLDDSRAVARTPLPGPLAARLLPSAQECAATLRHAAGAQSPR